MLGFPFHLHSGWRERKKKNFYNFVVALIIDSFADNSKKGFGLLVVLFSSLFPFSPSATKAHAFIYIQTVSQLLGNSGNLSKICSASLIKLVKPRWASLWETDMALCKVNVLLTSSRASCVATTGLYNLNKVLLTLMDYSSKIPSS